MTAPVPQGTVQIESGTNSNLVLDVDGSGRIIQWTRDESKQTQSWRLVPVSGTAGLFHIARASDDTQVLVAVDASILAVQRLVSTNKAHQWAIRNMSGEICELENQLNRRVPSVLNASTQPGESVILWDNLNAINQKWRLVSLRSESTGGGAAAIGGFAGAVPLCEWQAIPTIINGRAHVPIILELYRDPLSRLWPLVDNKRAKFTRSISLIDAGAVERSQALIVGTDVASAAVVRPGPDFDPSFFYKITLFNDPRYTEFMMPLTIGVYPDLHRYTAGDSTSSILFERGIPKDFSEDFSAAASYYYPLLVQ